MLRISPKPKESYLKLLQDTPETYYWVGFLLADGAFTERQITLNLSSKDLNHLMKFSEYFQAPLTQGTYRINGKPYSICTARISNKLLVGDFRKKFSIPNRKTYNPVEFSLFERDDLFISTVLGFIDGDGNIDDSNCSPTIGITVHQNWFSVLKTMTERLSNLSSISLKSPKLLSENKARVRYSRKLGTWLKSQALRLKLPVMERKWSKIDLGKITVTENMWNTIEHYKSIRPDCKNDREAAKKLGINFPLISYWRNLGYIPKIENTDYRKGSNCKMAKLTEGKAFLIKRMYETGLFTQKNLGEIFKVGQNSISSLIIGHTWSHIK